MNILDKRTDESATDVEVALCLAGHIAHPCEDSRGWNIRRFYMSEARRFAEQIKNETAREILEAVLEKYSD